MISKMVEIANNWKDVFWIIFTLVATITTVLTYLQVRKSFHQNLYDKVIEAQLELYNNILILLGNSVGDFLISLDLENYIKYNLIGHLTSKGILIDIEECRAVHTFYMNHLNTDNKPDQELQLILSNISGFCIELNDDLKIDSLEADIQCAGKVIDVPSTTRVEVRDICDVLLRNPTFEEIFNRLEKNFNNIYMPKKLKIITDNFEKQLTDIFCNKTFKLIHRKENQIFSGQKGDQIEMDFDNLYNELISDQTVLDLEYENMKKEIRRMLKIDNR